jgi:hypothetical protein
MLTFLRFTSIMALAFVTIIVAPAHWVSGSSMWTVAACMLFAATSDSAPLTLVYSMAGRCYALRMHKLGSQADGDRDLSSPSTVSPRFP